MPKDKLLRVAGLPAVQALFATAPARVERLFFLGELRREVSDYCGVLSRARKPYRQVGTEELARVAGTVLHGGVVAIARPQPPRPFEPGEPAHWAKDGKLLLLLDGIGNPHNLGAIARTATNIRSGARTPVSGMVHALTLLAVLLIFAYQSTKP